MGRRRPAPSSWRGVLCRRWRCRSRPSAWAGSASGGAARWRRRCDKGRESSMPVVPWVRPSQGSVQAPAKGMASRDFRVMAASATSAPSSQWPVWKPRAMGVPSAARRPPWVLRIRTSEPSSFCGSQPMPAFWLRPKRLPEGAVSSISGVMGSRPRGPGAWVATSSSLSVVVSRTEARVMVGMGFSCSGSIVRCRDG